MSQRAVWREGMELPSEEPLATAWAWGPYKEGMGGQDSHYRERYACRAIKQQLLDLGYDVNMAVDKIGFRADAAIREFQQANGLVEDGEAGPRTCSALFRMLIEDVEEQFGIPGHWLVAHGYWESGDFDPGAELTNPDGSRDRGLFQDNDEHGPYKLTDDEAFDPRITTRRRGEAMAKFANDRIGQYCLIQDTKAVKKFWAWAIAVSSFRTPVGAGELAKEGDTVVTPRRIFESPNYPDNLTTADWESAAAYYILRIAGVKRTLQ